MKDIKMNKKIVFSLAIMLMPTLLIASNRHQDSRVNSSVPAQHFLLTPQHLPRVVHAPHDGQPQHFLYVPPKSSHTHQPASYFSQKNSSQTQHNTNDTYLYEYYSNNPADCQHVPYPHNQSAHPQHSAAAPTVVLSPMFTSDIHALAKEFVRIFQYGHADNFDATIDSEQNPILYTQNFSNVFLFEFIKAIDNPKFLSFTLDHIYNSQIPLPDYKGWEAAFSKILRYNPEFKILGYVGTAYYLTETENKKLFDLAYAMKNLENSKKQRRAAQSIAANAQTPRAAKHINARSSGGDSRPENDFRKQHGRQSEQGQGIIRSSRASEDIDWFAKLSNAYNARNEQENEQKYVSIGSLLAPEGINWFVTESNADTPQNKHGGVDLECKPIPGNVDWFLTGSNADTPQSEQESVDLKCAPIPGNVNWFLTI